MREYESERVLQDKGGRGVNVKCRDKVRNRGWNEEKEGLEDKGGNKDKEGRKRG